MRVAWVTPLARESAIGAVTVGVAEEMRRTVDLDLWSSDEGQRHPTRVPVVRYAVGDAFEQALRGYEAVVYSLGDHYPFHRDVFRMARRVPGIIVLHDFVLHHFFMGHYLEPPGRVDAYVEAMERWYGEEARAAALASFDLRHGRYHPSASAAHAWETDRVVDWPLFEEALTTATGVVVHSEFLRARVAAVTNAPVRHIPLPQRPASFQGRAPERQEPGLVLLTVGHVNPNKRVLEVIEVLGRHPDLAGRLRYVVAGQLPPGEYPDQLRAAIARYGLDSTVTLLGHCAELDLWAWLGRADICVTLRHPVMEGASLSLVEQMAAGKPAIVTNAGVYAEAPDDCVRKIDAGRELEQLPVVLRELMDDVPARRAMGARARAHAESVHRADRYAADLIAFIHEAGDFAAMAQFTDRVATALRQVGVLPAAPIIDRIARESATLFGEPETSPWRPGR